MLRQPRPFCLKILSSLGQPPSTSLRIFSPPSAPNCSNLRCPSSTRVVNLIELGDGVKLSGSEIRALLASKAAAESARLSRPRSRTPTGPFARRFQAPEGLPKFEFRTDDPLLAQARTWAHKAGLTQEQFAEALALYAGSQLISQQQVTAARNSEVAKLGATGMARINALDTFFRATLGAPRTGPSACRGS